MGTKAEELKKCCNGEGCLGKAGMEEPIFILRAKDKTAPKIVRAWAKEAKARGCPEDKVNEALSLAQKMEDWQKDKNNGAKYPD